jgi:hypothetical protein
MSTYVEVPRKALEDALQSWGFTREPVRGEITYVRKHHVDPKFCVRVYTSVPEFNDTARERGEDAIRVVSTLQWTRKNEDVPRRKVLYRARVFRVTSVEGVISRLHDKAREAYIAINSHRAKASCSSLR